MDHEEPQKDIYDLHRTPSIKSKLKMRMQPGHLTDNKYKAVCRLDQLHHRVPRTNGSYGLPPDLALYLYNLQDLSMSGHGTGLYHLIAAATDPEDEKGIYPIADLVTQLDWPTGTPGTRRSTCSVYWPTLEFEVIRAMSTGRDLFEPRKRGQGWAQRFPASDRQIAQAKILHGLVYTWHLFKHEQPIPCTFAFITHHAWKLTKHAIHPKENPHPGKWHMHHAELQGEHGLGAHFRDPWTLAHA